MTAYDDGATRIDTDGVLLRRYYFPAGRPKLIAYENIRGARSAPLRLANGRWRLWGSAPLTVWLGWDRHRPRHCTLVVLDVGRRMKPAFTPADPDAALAALAARVDLTRG